MNEHNPEEQPQNQEQGQEYERTFSQSVSEPGKIKRQLREWWFKLKKFSKECRRVLKVTQKPNKEEFITIAKVSALGMTIIGLIGFALSMIQQLIL